MIFEIKRIFNRGIEPTTEHSGKDSNKRVHDLNTTRHARKGPKTKVEVNKTKDTTRGHVQRKTSNLEEPVPPGMFPTFSDLWFSHHSALRLGFFLSKPFFLLFSQLTPLYSLFSHFPSLPRVVSRWIGSCGFTPNTISSRLFPSRTSSRCSEWSILIHSNLCFALGTIPCCLKVVESFQPFTDSFSCLFFWRIECPSGKYLTIGGKTGSLTQLCP